MRVMGIDPGTRVVGFGIVDRVGTRLRAVEFGAIRVDTEAAVPARYRQIFERLSATIETHRPREIAIESIFSGKSPRSAIKIGEGRGLALLAAGLCDVPVSEYEATVVKKAVVGTGRGTKKQVQELVRVLLDLEEPPRPYDAADALAIAICHVHRRRIDATAASAREAGSAVLDRLREAADDSSTAAPAVALAEMIAAAKKRSAGSSARSTSSPTPVRSRPARTR